ncbi:MAG: DivIVA domain-containing protein [Clostridiales bacterium]|nr:DivIVA domain-containing protein [Clostridiales bacterium]
MKFKKVLRGYDPKEVNKFLTETAAKEQEIRVSQKERIAELTEENRALRKLVRQYHADEQAISNSLIASQNLAQEVRHDADKYSEFVLTRAKIFCASWRAYSRTLVAALSDDEVRELNLLQRKIENLISAYEGKEALAEVVAAAANPDKKHGFSNPISKIEDAGEQIIDLNELTNPTQSLEEICAELGIIKK